MHSNKPSYYISVLRLLLVCALSLMSIVTRADENSSSPSLETQAQAQTWKAFNIDTVQNYIIPAYNELNTQVQALNKSIENLCLQPINSDEKRKQSQQLFNTTMDAWQYIQNIQFGPIQTFMRNYSMQFWPDKKNHVSKHLSQLLNSKSNESLDEEAFHKASVSIKGLPAIERFLFDKDLNQSLLNKPFNCKVLVRISSYIAETTNSLVIEWHEMSTEFANTGQLDGYFEDDIEAATTLLKTLIEPIEVIRDLKILRPLGSEFGQQKPSRLESWRSQRSLRNIQMNIKSLADFYQGTQVDNTVKSSSLSSILHPAEAERIHNQFDKIFKQLKAIDAPLESSIETETAYKDLNDLSSSLKTLHELLQGSVNNKGIHLGFNSRDGD